MATPSSPSSPASPASDVFRTPPTSHTPWLEQDPHRTPRSNIFNRPSTSTSTTSTATTSTTISKSRNSSNHRSPPTEWNDNDDHDNTYAEDIPRRNSSEPFLEHFSNDSDSIGDGDGDIDIDIDIDVDVDHDDLEEQLAALGVLDDDDDDVDVGEQLEENEYSEDDSDDWDIDRRNNGDSPLVSTRRIGGKRGSNRGGRWKERIWDDDIETNGPRGPQLVILELIPPLILSYPLFLLPILPLLPQAFLPAGVILFLPSFIIVVILSACASIVAVYLARYLNVASFQDTCKRLLGVWGLQMGRGLIMGGIFGVCVGALRAMHPILEPVFHTLFPGSSFLQSRILWTSLLSLTLLPPILPTRLATYSSQFRQSLILLLPLVVFLVIGRTVEIVKVSEAAAGVGQEDGFSYGPLASPVEEIIKRLEDSGWASRGRGLFDDQGGIGSAAAFTIIAAFFSPHIHTLTTHSTLSRTSRPQFYIPVFAVSLALLILCLPFVLVPYYLLPTAFRSDPTTSSNLAISPAGIFAIYPTSESDHWLNLSRVSTVALLLVSASHWVGAGREMMIRAVGAQREGRAKAGRWVGFGIWVVVGGVACLGGWTADKVEVVGVLCVILVGWLLPSLFFVTTFHVWTPLAIVFPSQNPITQTPNMPSSPAFTSELVPTTSSMTGVETPSILNASFDILLARKERQLQKKRTGRRLWQDLIVFVGIFPVGALGTVWTVARLVGVL